MSQTAPGSTVSGVMLLNIQSDVLASTANSNIRIARSIPIIHGVTSMAFYTRTG